MIRRRSLLLTLATSACASPDPRLHTLAAAPGIALFSRALVIAIRRPILPRYAERREIVRLDQADGLKAEENDWWGEPLVDMVQRVLATDLAQRLPSAQVLDDIIAGDAATVEVETEFQRFDSDPAGAALLGGFAGIVLREQPKRLLPIQAQADSRGIQTGSRVAAMSQALGLVADQIATGLIRWQSSAMSGRLVLTPPA